MKKKYSLLMAQSLLLLLSANNIRAKEVPCFVFSGNSEEEHNIDISVYNRIYFDNNSFIVSNTNDSNSDDIVLQYILFNHLEFKDAEPTVIVGIKEITVNTDIYMKYNSAGKCLRIESGEDKIIDLTIYNLSGNTVLASNIKTNTEISLNYLVTGIYFAVATDGKNKIVVKFIVK